MGMWVRQLFETLLLKTPLSPKVSNPQVEKNWSSNFFPVQIFKSTFGQKITDSFDELYGLPVLEILARRKTVVWRHGYHVDANKRRSFWIDKRITCVNTKFCDFISTPQTHCSECCILIYNIWATPLSYLTILHVQRTYLSGKRDQNAS